MTNFYNAPRSASVLRDIINMELAAQKVRARAVHVVEAPQCWTFLVKMAFGGKVEQVERLAATFQEKTGSPSCRIDRSPHGLLVQIAKAPEDRAFVTTESLASVFAHQRQSLRASRIPVGVTPTGQVAWLDLADEMTPHVAVFGLTGSGKTTLLSWMAWWVSLSKQPCLVLASPKVDDYAEFSEASTALHPPVRDEAGFAKLLAWLKAELDRRSADASLRSPLVVVIDEVPEWIKKVPRTDDILESVASNGRALNMHLLLGSQRADEASVGRSAFNMTCRIVGRLGSGVFKYSTTGVTGADVNLLGKGDMLMVTPTIQRFQSPVLGASDYARIKGKPGELSMPDPEPVVVVPLAAARATDIDEQTVLDAFRGGMSQREAMKTFKLGHDRAKRLREQALAAA